MVETTSIDSTAYRALYTTAISRGRSTHNSNCPNCGALKIIAVPNGPRTGQFLGPLSLNGCNLDKGCWATEQCMPDTSNA